MKSTLHLQSSARDLRTAPKDATFFNFLLPPGLALCMTYSISRLWIFQIHHDFTFKILVVANSIEVTKIHIFLITTRPCFQRGEGFWQVSGSIQLAKPFDHRQKLSKTDEIRCPTEEPRGQIFKIFHPKQLQINQNQYKTSFGIYLKENNGKMMQIP